jgi:hypothetical protein
MGRGVHLHWNSTTIREVAKRYEVLTGEKCHYATSLGDTGLAKRISGTAILANLSRQSAATVAVTHYFDLDRICRDCRRPFIFFAEEQKYWYEVLQFSLNFDCVRCVPCRKRQQSIARLRRRYEELCHVSERSLEEVLEMADCCLSLIEQAVFASKCLQNVRTLLNRLASQTDDVIALRRNELMARVRAIDA